MESQSQLLILSTTEISIRFRNGFRFSFKFPDSLSIQDIHQGFGQSNVLRPAVVQLR